MTDWHLTLKPKTQNPKKLKTQTAASGQQKNPSFLLFFSLVIEFFSVLKLQVQNFLIISHSILTFIKSNFHLLLLLQLLECVCVYFLMLISRVFPSVHLHWECFIVVIIIIFPFLKWETTIRALSFVGSWLLKRTKKNNIFFVI